MATLARRAMSEPRGSTIVGLRSRANEILEHLELVAWMFVRKSGRPGEGFEVRTSVYRVFGNETGPSPPGRFAEQSMTINEDPNCEQALVDQAIEFVGERSRAAASPPKRLDMNADPLVPCGFRGRGARQGEHSVEAEPVSLGGADDRQALR